jgi:dTDP-4-dehydrorhamnose reductase
MTGANGTVGAPLKAYFESQGHEVIGWDRKENPIIEYQPMEDYVRQVKPHVLYHLAIPSVHTGRENESWLVNYEWTSELAWITKLLQVKFIFTSTAMVFSDAAKGPFTIHSKPDAESGYGYEKRLAESRSFFQNPATVVARLGWQIGEKAGSNNMIDFFDRKMKTDGEIVASKKWFPACSFQSDTVQALAKLAEFPAGLYLIDSNRKSSFFEIATALNKRHGNRWIIKPGEHFVFDQRMLDDRLAVPPLSVHLP